MEKKSYTSTHPLGHTGPVTGSLYLYLYYYYYYYYYYSVMGFITQHFSKFYGTLENEASVAKPLGYK